MDRGAWWGYSPWGRQESDVTEGLSTCPERRLPGRKRDTRGNSCDDGGRDGSEEATSQGNVRGCWVAGAEGFLGYSEKGHSPRDTQISHFSSRTVREWMPVADSYTVCNRLF